MKNEVYTQADEGIDQSDMLSNMGLSSGFLDKFITGKDREVKTNEDKEIKEKDGKLKPAQPVSSATSSSSSAGRMPPLPQSVPQTSETSANEKAIEDEDDPELQEALRLSLSDSKSASPEEAPQRPFKELVQEALNRAAIQDQSHNDSVTSTDTSVPIPAPTPIRLETERREREIAEEQKREQEEREVADREARRVAEEAERVRQEEKAQQIEKEKKAEEKVHELKNSNIEYKSVFDEVKKLTDDYKNYLDNEKTRLGIMDDKKDEKHEKYKILLNKIKVINELSDILKAVNYQAELDVFTKEINKKGNYDALTVHRSSSLWRFLIGLSVIGIPIAMGYSKYMHGSVKFWQAAGEQKAIILNDKLMEKGFKIS